jgi:hypothetical protein
MEVLSGNSGRPCISFDWMSASSCRRLQPIPRTLPCVTTLARLGRLRLGGVAAGAFSLAVIYRHLYRAHSVKSLERNILGFVGLSPVCETLIGSVEAMSEQQLKGAVDGGGGVESAAGARRLCGVHAMHRETPWRTAWRATGRFAPPTSGSSDSDYERPWSSPSPSWNVNGMPTMVAQRTLIRYRITAQSGRCRAAGPGGPRGRSLIMKRQWRIIGAAVI